MKGLQIAILHAATQERPDERDTLDAAEAVRAALAALGHRPWIAWLQAGPSDIAGVAAARPDLVFNLVEAIDGDGTAAGVVPSLLEGAGLRYTGCGPLAERLCVDKPAMKRRMVETGLPTPRWCEDGTGLADLPQVIVKARAEHASFGMDAASVMPGPFAAAGVAARTLEHGAPFFAEAYVPGREFNLAMLDGATLPPSEILFEGFPDDRPLIVDYAAKWIESDFAFANTPRRFDFPDADGALLAALRSAALRAWDAFALSGYARVDFRVDEGGAIHLLEVNTNPCLSPDAGFAAAAAQAGMSYRAMIGAIVAAAARRQQAAA